MILFHFKPRKYLFTIGFILILYSHSLNGQESAGSNPDSSIKHQISFRHDNDFLVFTDRYYSSGLIISYGKTLDQGIFRSGHEQIMFKINQEIFTPSNTKTTNIVEMDRPYAGFLGFTVGWSYTKNNHDIETNVMIGLAGKSSGAGNFHRWYHKALEVPQPPTWVYEIANSFHLNIYNRYAHEWQLVNSDFAVFLAVQPEFALGTKDIYAQPELITYFGKRNSMRYSSAYNKIGAKDRELFFALRTSYRWVAHNAMLEGNLFGDNSPFLIDPNAGFFNFGFDLQHRKGQNEYWFGYRLNSAETSKSNSHKYIILSCSRNF